MSVYKLMGTVSYCDNDTRKMFFVLDNASHEKLVSANCKITNKTIKVNYRGVSEPKSGDATIHVKLCKVSFKTPIGQAMGHTYSLIDVRYSADEK